MQEFFLQHIWQYQKMTPGSLQTAQGEPLQILHPGQCLKEEGPDFFNARIIVGNQKWAGNIEIHLKSSDWYHHKHEINKKYDNVVLHVVWEHDMAVFRPDNSEIPVLILKEYTPDTLLASYRQLLKEKNWICCENELREVAPFFWLKWKERLFFDRLERKIKPVEQLLKDNKNDWEATLFCCLAQSYGLNTNGDAFFRIARSLPFNVIRKERFQEGNLEALLFGMGNLLEHSGEDTYFRNLQNQWNTLKEKYRFGGVIGMSLQFYKLRPGNFPTIRLMQLAQLYQQRPYLFDEIMQTDTISGLYTIFNIRIPEYWQTHYVFDKVSKARSKKMSPVFIGLLFVNAILPLRFLYARYFGNDFAGELSDMAKAITAEKNSITDRFKQLGVTVENAFDSQALLQLKKEYCDTKSCLNCDIGLKLLGY